MDNNLKALKELEVIRQDIDAIDAELTELLLKRMECVIKVAKVKAEYQLPVLNSNREQQVLNKVIEKSGDLGSYNAEVFKKIMEVSKDYQNSLLKK